MALAVFDLMAFGVAVRNLGGDYGDAHLPRHTAVGLTLNYTDPQGTFRLLTTGEVQWGEGTSWILGAEGGIVVGGACALYQAELDTEEFERVEAFLPIAAPFVIPRSYGDVTIGEVPEGSSAVLVHRGPFAGIGETYLALGAWVARHAEPSGAKR